MFKYPLSNRQKSLLQTIAPGLNNGTIEAEWIVDQSGNDIIEIVGLNDVLRHSEWANVKRTDFDKFVECGFFKITYQGNSGRNVGYSLDEYRINEAVSNNFGEAIKIPSVLPLSNQSLSPVNYSSGPINNNNTENSFEFDFVISYAGEDREQASKLFQALKLGGARIFYDVDFQAEMWGQNLYEHLARIYSKSGRYFIPLISHHYVSKKWTRHEWENAQETAIENIDKSYILPIRLDDTELPGLPSTTAYQDARVMPMEQIAQIALQKLALAKQSVLPNLKVFPEPVVKAFHRDNNEFVNGKGQYNQVIRKRLIKAAYHSAITLCFIILGIVILPTKISLFSFVIWSIALLSGTLASTEITSTSVQEFKNEKQLVLEGQVLQGNLIQADIERISGSTNYDRLTVRYKFVSPMGIELEGGARKLVHRSANWKIPTKGTPYKIMYANDDNFTIL